MEAQLDASDEFEKEMDLELESRLQAAKTSKFRMHQNVNHIVHAGPRLQQEVRPSGK